MHHVSTSYVNCNKPTNSAQAEEINEIPNMGDFEEFANQINLSEPQVLEREEPKILKKFNFPNTYTLTKNMAEQALQKNRGPNLRLSITRPAVVCSCIKYPFPGWTDSIAAGGAVVFSIA